MRRIIIMSLVAIIFASLADAQEKTFSMDEAIIGYTMGLYPKNIYGNWQPNSVYYTYNEDNAVVQLNAKKNAVDELFNLSKINTALRAHEKDTFARLPYIRWIDKESFLVRDKLHYYRMNAANLNIVEEFELLPGDNGIDYESKAKDLMLAVNNENSLYVINGKERIEVGVSNTDELVYGQTVSRSEFGIYKGTFWSPQGNLLAYYIKDNGDVKQYPLVDITAREAETDMIRYPMAGMDSEHVHLGIFNPKTKKSIFIEKENAETEQYLTNITWSPDEKHIYIQVLNREQNHMKLNAYSAETGMLVKTLFEEKHKKYVEPYHPLLFLPNSKDEFIYQTRKDGYNHLYLYKTDGSLIHQITTGNWEVTNILGIDENGKTVYYESTEASPIERHIYKTDIYKPSKKTQLSEVSATHRASLSTDGSYIIDKYSSTTIPSVIQIIQTSNGKRQIIREAENPLKEYNLGEMTISTLKAADDSTDLYYRLIKPIDFDSTKTYPTIVYVYGGPHAQLISNSWNGGISLWQQYMAQNGYVMLTIDNRGSANRGLEFENVIHRECGKNEMLDQLKGIKFLQSLPYVDTTRIGVHGWSYGGFMTTSLLTNHPNIYKVGVAGGPVIDWKYYEIMYGERYMDKPDENPEGYASTSLLPMAEKLNRKLLIIHGYVDPTVVIQHSLQFIRECVKHNKQVDYFVYPRAEHNVRGKDRIHLMQKVTDYFNDYLK